MARVLLSTSWARVLTRCSLPFSVSQSAVGGSNLCTAHGGGRRCHFQDCTRSAQSSTNYCVRHGGGRKCQVEGCQKVRPTFMLLRNPHLVLHRSRKPLMMLCHRTFFGLVSGGAWSYELLCGSRWRCAVQGRRVQQGTAPKRTPRNTYTHTNRCKDTQAATNHPHEHPHATTTDENQLLPSPPPSVLRPLTLSVSVP